LYGVGAPRADPNYVAPCTGANCAVVKNATNNFTLEEPIGMSYYSTMPKIMLGVSFIELVYYIALPVLNGYTAVIYLTPLLYWYI